MVASMVRKSYLSAKARRRGKLADRNSGFEGNSVNSAKMGGGSVGLRLDLSSKRTLSRSISVSIPKPRK